MGDAVDLSPTIRLGMQAYEDFLEETPLPQRILNLFNAEANTTGNGGAGDRLRARAFGDKNETARRLTEEKYGEGSPWLDVAKNAAKFAGGAIPGGGLARGVKLATGLGLFGGATAESIAHGVGASREDARTVGMVGNVVGSLVPSAPAMAKVLSTGAKAVVGKGTNVLSRTRALLDPNHVPEVTRLSAADDIAGVAGVPRASLAAKIDPLDMGPMSAQATLSDPTRQALLAAEQKVLTHASGVERPQYESAFRASRAYAEAQALARIRSVAEQGVASNARGGQIAAVRAAGQSIDDGEAAALVAAGATEDAALAAQHAPVLAEVRAAREAARAPSTNMRELDAAEATSRAIAANLDEAKAAETAAWAAVKEVDDTPILKSEVERVIRLGVSNATDDVLAKSDFTKVVVKQLIDDMNEVIPGLTVPASFVSTMKTRVREVVKAATETSLPSTNASSSIATRVGNDLLDMIGSTPGTEALRTAVATSRKKFNMDSSVLRKATDAERKREAPVAAGKLLEPGVEGTKVRYALDPTRDPEGRTRRALADSLRAKFDRVYQGKAKNAAKAQTWLNAHEEVLSEFPEVKAALQLRVTDGAVVKPLKGLAKTIAKPLAKARVAAEKEAARAASAKRRVLESSAPAKFAEPESSPDAARAVLRGKAPVDDIKAIMANARAQGAAAVEDVKAAFREAMLTSTSKVKGDNAAVRKFGADTLEDMEANRLGYAEVFGADEMSTIEKAYKQVQRNLAKSDFPVPAEVGVRHTSVWDLAVTLGARMGVTSALSTVFKVPSLIAAGTASKAATNILQRMPDEKYRRAFVDMLAHPDKYKAAINALEKAKSSRAVGRAMLAFAHKFSLTATPSIVAVTAQEKDK